MDLSNNELLLIKTALINELENPYSGSQMKFDIEQLIEKVNGEING